MAGIRLWIAAISSFGSTVTMAAERIEPPSGECHSLQRPAKAKGWRDLRKMKCGILIFVPGWDFHS